MWLTTMIVVAVVVAAKEIAATVNVNANLTVATVWMTIVAGQSSREC